MLTYETLARIYNIAILITAIGADLRSVFGASRTSPSTYVSAEFRLVMNLTKPMIG